MRYTLRPYQRECVDCIVDIFKRHGTQLVQLPTGAGKTVVLWKFLQESGLRGLVIAPTLDLVDQIYDKGIEIVGPIVSMDRDARTKTHLVMTQQALYRNYDLLDSGRWDVLIVDEAHHAGAKSYGKLLQKCAKNKIKVLGLTATPERNDGISLLTQFEVLSFQRNFLDLMRDKFLCDLFCYRVKTEIEIQEKNRNKGDLSEEVLRYLDVDDRNKIILDTARNECADKKTLIFCLNVHHAEEISMALRESGRSSAFIHGGMSKHDREKVLLGFRSGSYQYLCGVQLLCEGFDDPGIEALILGRPTKSKSLYCQMIGRGVRPNSGKKGCYVYDISDANHNICSFNVLGCGFPVKSQMEERLKPGMRLLQFADEFDKVKLGSHEYVEHDLFGANKELDATASQIAYLSRFGLPVDEHFSFYELGYLIWKMEKFKEHGIDTKAYWEKWRNDIQVHGSFEGEGKRH
jgi:superfamily II DNA or RNA helicase